jgi:hypothetical protein
MPTFTKAPQALVDQFTAAIHGLPDVQPRNMFGYPARSRLQRRQRFACVFPRRPDRAPA